MVILSKLLPANADGLVNEITPEPFEFPVEFPPSIIKFVNLFPCAPFVNTIVGEDVLLFLILNNCKLLLVLVSGTPLNLILSAPLSTNKPEVEFPEIVLIEVVLESGRMVKLNEPAPTPVSPN